MIELDWWWFLAAVLTLGYLLLWRYGARLLGWLTALETSLDADKAASELQRSASGASESDLAGDTRDVGDAVQIRYRLDEEMKRRRRR